MAKAKHVPDRLIEIVQGLARFPERGSDPKELVALGVKEYRETLFKPYRVIYRVRGTRSVIYLIVDGWQDMQSESLDAELDHLLSFGGQGSLPYESRARMRPPLPWISSSPCPCRAI